MAKATDRRTQPAGLDEFEIHPTLALRKERNATTSQHRVDLGPVLVDQPQLGRLGGESRTADSVVEKTTFGNAFQSAAHPSLGSSGPVQSKPPPGPTT